MLRLLFGIAGSGKTTRMLQDIEKRAQSGQHSMLLVPEQFSSSAEGMVYRLLQDEWSGYVEVLSFRTLGERILKACGGVGLQVLGDAGRAVFVRRALDSVAAQLRTFAKQRTSTAFCNLCAQTLSELKTAGATPEKLLEIARAGEDGKLEELALVYSAYEAQIDGTALDPEDKLVLAAGRADCGYLAGKACFIDSFDGFTAPEYTMIAQLLGLCDSVRVAFCAPGMYAPGMYAPGMDENMAGPDLFTPVRKAAQRLVDLADKLAVPVEKPECLAQLPRPQKPALAVVNRLLAEQDDVPGNADPEKTQPQEAAAVATAGEGVCLTAAGDEWEEVRLAAAEMRRLALLGVPFSRMAVICRDVAAYESVVRRQFALYGIPLFVDAAGSIEYTAPVAFLRAALQLLRGGLATRGILALLKTGLCGYADAQIAALENYAYTWNLKAADWRAPFEKNPDGLLAAQTPEAEQQRKEAERLRAAVVPALEKFIAGARGRTTRETSRRLYLLLDHFGAAEQLEALATRLEAGGDVLRAEGARRAWDLAMELLDQMAALLGEETLPPGDYDDMFLLLVRSTEFAQPPQTLECATLTGADRMRLDKPDYCFVVGACEGEFPMQVGYSGLLTHTDRERLVAAGVEMPGSFENRTLLEEMFFYRALASPRQGLYISWPKRRAGVSCAMSAPLEAVRLALEPPPLQPPLQVLAATPAAAFDLLGALYRGNSPQAAALHAALLRCGWEEEALALLRDVDNPGLFAVAQPELLESLLGRELRLSATVAESWYKCRFAYYMERVLRVRPRAVAEVSPLESGTFVHYILEMVLREAGAGFATLPNEQLEELAAKHADAFIEEFLPQNTKRGAWQLGQIKQATGRLLCYMRDAAAQSDFSIDALELGIGTGDEDVPPLRVDTGDGRSVWVSGKIDRVDVLRRDGKTYLCIVDYKTGSKKFSLDDVYFGLNMQMMIYMAALCKNGRQRYPNPVPAGVLYLTGDPAPESGGRGGQAKPVYKMDGLLLQNEELLHSMDHSRSGVYVPVRFNKNGTARAAASLAEMDKFGAILRHVEGLLANMAQDVYGGNFCARPLVKGGASPCAWCPYRAACRHEDGWNENEVKAPPHMFETQQAQDEEVRP